MLIRDVDLNVSVVGNGRPLLWNHGLTGNMLLDDETRLINADEIASVAKLVRWDTRGHGASGFSPDPQDYTWANLALDALEIARSLEIDEFMAGGSSMGCAVSLHAAVLAPEKVKALVLVAPPEAWETDQGKQEWYESTAALVEAGGPPALVEAWKNPSTFWGVHSTPAVLRHLLVFNPQSLPLIFHGGGMAPSLPTKEQVSTIRVPTLILAWDNDDSHPISTAYTLKELIPSATLELASSVDEVFAWSGKISTFLQNL